MSEKSIPEYKADGWDNCGPCGYFYNKRILTTCPMCRRSRDALQSFMQPEYESPSLT